MSLSTFYFLFVINYGCKITNKNFVENKSTLLQYYCILLKRSSSAKRKALTSDPAAKSSFFRSLLREDSILLTSRHVSAAISLVDIPRKI